MELSPVRKHLNHVAPPKPTPRIKGWRQVETQGGTLFRRTDGTIVQENRNDGTWYSYFPGFVADYVMECDGDGGDSDEIKRFASANEARDYIDKGWPLG